VGLTTVVGRVLKFFEQMEDPYIKQRGGDIEDVHNRLQTLLAGARTHHDLSELTEDTIVVAHSLSHPTQQPPPGEGHRDRDRCRGRTSHTAILAQALGIAAVVGLHDASQKIRTGDLLVLDGEEGTVDLARIQGSSPISTAAGPRSLARNHLPCREGPSLNKPRTAVPIALLANIEFPEEIAVALPVRGRPASVCYRSEFLFLTRSPIFPRRKSTGSSMRTWRRASRPRRRSSAPSTSAARSTFMRPRQGRLEPVLGLRAIRFCLKRSDIFKTQLRGILRASVNRNLRVMLPLISGVAELRAAKRLMDEVRGELTAEGIPSIRISIWAS